MSAGGDGMMETSTERARHLAAGGTHLGSGKEKVHMIRSPRRIVIRRHGREELSLLLGEVVIAGMAGQFIYQYLRGEGMVLWALIPMVGGLIALFAGFAWVLMLDRRVVVDLTRSTLGIHRYRVPRTAWLTLRADEIKHFEIPQHAYPDVPDATAFEPSGQLLQARLQDGTALPLVQSRDRRQMKDISEQLSAALGIKVERALRDMDVEGAVEIED